MAEISGHHHYSGYPQENHLYISCQHHSPTDTLTKTSELHDFLHSDGVARHHVSPNSKTVLFFLEVVAFIFLAQPGLGYHHFRGSRRYNLLGLSEGPAAVPAAPSAVKVPAPSLPKSTVGMQSLNKAPCGNTPAGSTVPLSSSAGGVPSSSSLGKTFYMFAVGAPGSGVSQGSSSVGKTSAAVAAPAQGVVPVKAASTTAGGACVVGASSTPEADNSTGKYVGMGIGGLLGLVTIAAIVQKYKTMGSYSSFWGRMLGLLSGAAAGGLGYMDFSAHSANDCANLFGEAELSTPCPCLACAYVLFAFAAFQLTMNLPFLYAGEKSISKMYASFGLLYQGSLMLTVSGAAAGGIKTMSGSFGGMAVTALGMVVGLLFLLGWFKGEDGVLGRLFQSAKDMLNSATEQAAALVDDGLKVFGLNADERNKVTTNNIYNFCRVIRGPDWSAGDEDGGPNAAGGEVIGYIGDNGVAEGVAVVAGSPGWAKVKWDSGKTAEYRIGAGNKFQLKMAEETEGIVDKLMGQTFAMFGYDPGANKAPLKDKKQIEFILTSKLPGEQEEEKEPELNNDSDNEGGRGDAGKKVTTDVSGEAGIVLTAEAFDSSGKSVGKCDDLKSMLFKSAIRHRQLGNKQDAIVIEFQKLPAEIALIALCAKLPGDRQLGHWASVNIRTTSVGHDLSRLSLSQQEGVQGVQKHQGSRGFLYFLLYTGGSSEWFAKKCNESLGSSHDTTGALNDKIAKFLAERDHHQPSKKKKMLVAEGKITSDLISVEEVFENLKIELKCEAQARELMSTKVTAMTEAYSTRLRQQGVPMQQANLQAKKLALIQINKQHQVIFQKTLVVKRAIYLKQRMHPVHAIILAKKDANRAALYDGKEAEIRQAVINTIKEEKEAAEETKRQQEAEASNSYSGQATALVSNMWGWATAEPEKSEKKKKKKKKDDEVEKQAPAAPALPPQFANMSPQQIAAIRALQQKQIAAKSAGGK